MKKGNMQNVSKTGDVAFEIREIEKMREKTNSYWSMVTNTCSGFLTLVCC
ncbi:MAG: hypothetical protein IIV45_03365 [Lachnospiraceae bacterium]|nr:hypothetical protein [Lachnospiraceae bacterium]